ncbi:hypothetical protein JCM3774_004963 [Rhodotorula dairenensis]
MPLLLLLSSASGSRRRLLAALAAVAALALALGIAAAGPSNPLYALVSLAVRTTVTLLVVLFAQLAFAYSVQHDSLVPLRGGIPPCGGGPAPRPPRAVQPLGFTSPAAWHVIQTRARWDAEPAPPRARAGTSAAGAALDSLLDLVVRDFIQTWYAPWAADSSTFPNAVERTVRDALDAVSVRVARVDWPEILVGRILPLLTSHLERCRLAELAVHGPRPRRAARVEVTSPPPPASAPPAEFSSDEADLFLATRYALETDSKKLHPAVDTASPNSKPAEEAWLRNLVDSILPLVLPEPEYESECVRVLVRELVACAVLLPVIDTLSDPDFWNRLIDEKAGAAIRDQRMVSQFRQALDRQEGAAATAATTVPNNRSFTAPPQLESSNSSPPSSSAKRSETINVRTSPRQFDAWLRGITKLPTLADAKRLRSDVTAQIRRAKSVTDGRQLGESVDGVSVAQWIDYIERLYAAKRKIDKRIHKLGGGSTGLPRAPSVYHITPPAAGTKFSFRDVLLEPDAVTYAMEYLERQRHAARAQFWLLVQGLKDPLEEFDAGEQDLVPPFLEVGGGGGAKRAEGGGGGGGDNDDDDEVRRAYLDDIRMVWDVYLAQDSFRSSRSLLETVKSFALRPRGPAERGTPGTPTELRAVRYALFAIQQEVLALLDEEDLPGFVKSDLYFRAAATLAAAAASAAGSNAPSDTLTPPPPDSSPLPIVIPPTPAAPTAAAAGRDPSLRGTSASYCDDSPTSEGGRPSDRPASPSPTPPPLLAAWMTRTRSSSPSRPCPASTAPKVSPLPSSAIVTATSTTSAIAAVATGGTHRTDLVAAATRTNTAPPQVSFHTVFDLPHARSQPSASATTGGGGYSPKGEVVEELSPSVGGVASAAWGNGSGSGTSAEGVNAVAEERKTPPAHNDSLEFLISPIEGAVDRTPLFVGEDEGRGREDLVDQEEDDGEEGERLETALLEAEEDDDSFVQVQTIDAIHDALSSILATSDAKGTATPRLDGSISSLPSLRDDTSTSSKRDTTVHGRPRSASSLRSTEAATAIGTSVPPSPGTGGGPPPLPARRNRPVFDDPETYEDTTPDSDLAAEALPTLLVPPSPDRLPVGPVPRTRLELAKESERLDEMLAKLASQQNLVEALIRKAELTGNAVELKILVKSRESLAREIRATSYQRDQLAAQAADDEISCRRTRITIPGTSVGQVNHLGTQTFQLYLVEVRQLGAEDEAIAAKAAWIVTKRYSEFATLHDKLRERYPAARTLDFPSKRLVGAWSKEFIEQRRLGLERYLQSLLRIEDICTGDELRAFLSKESIALPKTSDAQPRKTKSTVSAGPGFVRNLYRGLTSGIDDVLGTSTTSMLDAVVDRLSAQATDFAGQASVNLRAEDLVGQLASVGMTAGTMASRDEGLTSFTAPICDLFITLFDLKDKNNWIRRQAILIVLQQVLGGTIERKIRESVAMLLSPPQVAGYLDALRGTMWPAGVLRPKEEARTTAQKIATREAALFKLSALMPDVAANLIGRQNAKWGAHRLFAALQSKRLNKHLAYSVMEDLVDAIFPERTTARARPLFPT